MHIHIILAMAQALLSTRPQQHHTTTYCDLCRALSDTTVTVHVPATWCQQKKLLANDKDCPARGRAMRLAQCKSPEGQGCRREVTLRRDTFAGSHAAGAHYTANPPLEYQDTRGESREGV